MTFLAEPDLGSILYAVELPPFGGDTLFSSQLAAYDALSDTMKGLLDGLVGIHSAGPQYGGAGYSTQSTAMATKGAGRRRGEPCRAPRRHDPPGDRPQGPLRQPGVHDRDRRACTPESKALLGFLYQHARAEAFTCRLRWEPGTVAMWDNRSVQHYALHDYRGHRRVMRRITIRGERPR